MASLMRRGDKGDKVGSRTFIEVILKRWHLPIISSMTLSDVQMAHGARLD